MPMIKVVIIDPYLRTCIDTRIEAGDLNAIYAAIGNGCDIFQPSYPEALGNECVYVDEEGLWRQEAGFQLRGHHQPLLGRGIVIGTDENTGRSICTTWTADEVLANITGWYSKLPVLEDAEEQAS